MQTDLKNQTQPDPKTTTTTKGIQGENVALEYLKRHNYTILETNFVYGRFGEIDIVCEKDGYIIAVEVRMKTTHIFGSPEESLTLTKKRKIRKTLEFFCMKKGKNIEMIRADFISIVKGQKSFQLKHFKNIELA